MISAIIIILFVASSLNSILANSTSINKAEYNNFTSLCTNSIITCIDNIPSIQKADKDLKKHTDLILEQVNSTKLKEWINTLSSFHTRHTKSDHIENVAYWLKNELETLCENRVFFHNFTQIDENQTFHLKNIICTIQDSTASLPDNNTIIIGAHYDSRAENINNSEVRAPGADDNASGVSAILELVRILSHVNLTLNLEFVLFSGEEQGKWGSNKYIKYLDDKNRTKNIDLYINFDMIGYRPSNESNKVILEYDVGNKYLQNDNYSKTIALFTKQIASNYTNLQSQLAKLGNSDFIPFEELGSTVIGIHDEGVTKNPNYHKSSDTPNTLNIEYATSITKMTLATILELDRLNKYLTR
ncbi:MAG TPA: M20/M25/M40 family metallo-hydrolase [Nitrososphaeraceae archaeon]